MKLINRDHCVITGNKDLELLYSFKDFPVFMGCVEHPPEEDLKTDMNWWISKSSGSIQLNPLIPLDVLYADSHGSGLTGSLWDSHHTEFAGFLKKYNVRNVLEVGAGHGILVKKYLQMARDARWTIVEPNPAVESTENIRVIKGIFDKDFLLDFDIDFIVHSHLIEHLYRPDELLNTISRMLKEGQLHIFSVPHLEEMLRRKYTNCINFEHTVFLTETFIDYLLEKNNFEILEKYYFKDDHSIFYAARKVAPGSCVLPELPNEYAKNKQIYTDYKDFYLQLIEQLHERMRRHQGKVFLFGGHVFSQYLMGFGLDESRVECILDNDPDKQGKRLYGTRLMVESPRVLKGEKDAAVILRAGVYNEEIKEDIVSNINPDVIFWEE